MAELRMTPVAPVTPATQSASPNAGGPQASGADADSQQPSFAHVLKECGHGNHNGQKSATGNTAKADKTSAQPPSDQASAQTSPQADAAAALAAAMALSAAASTAADADADPKAATLAAAIGLADAGAATDTNALANPAVPADAAAAQTTIPAGSTASNTTATATIAAQGTSRNLPGIAADASTAKTATNQPATLTANTQTDKLIPDDGKSGASQPAAEITVKTAAEATLRTAVNATTNAAVQSGNPDAASVNHALNTLTAQGLSAQAAQQPAANAAQHTVNTPVGTPGWAEDVGQKLTWTAGHDNGRATFVLTPPQMGRVEVSINVHGDQASANFIAASPAAREALQDAMPRLREILAQAGIQLGQADVSAGQSGQSQADKSGTQDTARRVGASELAGTNIDILPAHGPWIQQGRGLIDTFA